jgi:hypothetical protein
MNVYDSRLGRLGNSIFRYLASTLFCIIYKAKRTYNISNTNAIFNDSMFINWMNNVLNNNIPNIAQLNYNFNGYYQHDKIFLKYKKEIIKWIKTHPSELLYTDGNIINNKNNNTINNTINNTNKINNTNNKNNKNNNAYNYSVQSYLSIDLLVKPNNLLGKPITYYDVVIHLRLEDFINNNNVIHPDSIINILNEIYSEHKYNKYCLVLNKPTTEIEKKYINYITSKYNITIESNSVLEDFHIMKNAKILVCSSSTLSWAASFFSDSLIKVYFPNKEKEYHESFSKPIENTIYYDIIKCGKNELLKLFNNFDVVIPLGPNDINFIKNSLEKNKINILNYRKIFIVTNLKNININEFKDYELIDENSFPFNLTLIQEYLGNNTRCGWYFQQLIKLYASFIIPNILDNYLVIDSDTIFLKPTIFFEYNIPLYNYGTEYHPPYFIHMINLHPSLIKFSNMSGITHHLIFQKNILTDLFKLVENFHNKLFYEIFLLSIEKKEILHSGASEYEIYFNFILKYYPNKYKIRKLEWLNTTKLENNLNCDYVSCHWYLR